MRRGGALSPLAYPIFRAVWMRDVREERRRDGAVTRGLYRDLSDPIRFVETFVVESWLEHLRQHERVTVADEGLRPEVYALLLEE
jgi:hypothetical protein